MHEGHATEDIRITSSTAITRWTGEALDLGLRWTYYCSDEGKAFPRKRECALGDVKLNTRI